MSIRRYLVAAVFAVLCSSASTVFAGSPPESDRSTLPAGYYLYMGEHPGDSAARWLRVDFNGKVSWMKDGSAVDIAATPGSSPISNATTGAAKQHPINSTKAKSSLAGTAATQTDAGVNWEMCDYPKIKWKAKSLGVPGAIAQLQTTFEQSTTDFSGGRWYSAETRGGKVKYILTVFKCIPHNCEIQVLDSTGFKLLQFSATDFHEIPGTELCEARESVPCNEIDYKKARDYSIKWIN